MTDPKHYEQLVQRYVEGSATQEEVELFFDLLQKGTLDSFLDKYDFDSIPRIKSATPKKGQYLKLWPYAAAASVIILITGFFLFKPGTRESSIQNTTAANTTPDALPGSKKAILRLSTGKQIILGSGNEEITDGNATIILNNNSIVYNGGSAEVVYNTVSIPRGGEFRVTLPDGTNVWLNASSSLRYPIVFNSAERRVTLTGEAYFEVAKNKQKPFIVASEGAEVKVLGTHFNVKAYPDEPFLKTTLEEGSVALYKNGEQKILKPGEGARILNTSNEISMVATNVAEDLAWKNGYFQFDKTDFATIMKQISRWYDIDIEYAHGKIPDKHFVGRISRQMNLSEILTIFKLSDVKFSKRGNVLVIEE